jgi:hypothetical protein
MFRGTFIVLAVYAVGHPHFDGARPAVLDKPLTAFHKDVNSVARDGMKVLGAFDGARRWEFLAPVSAALGQTAKQ